MKVNRRLLRINLTARYALILTILLGFMGGVAAVGRARYLSLIIQQVFLEDAALNNVGSMLWALLGIFILTAGLIWGMELMGNSLALQVKSDLRRQLYCHLLALGPNYTHGERSGELTNTLSEGIEALDAYYRQYLPQLVLAAMIPVSFLVFIFPSDALSGFVLLLTAPLIPLFMILIGNVAAALTRKQWVTLSRLSAYYLDVLQGLTTLKILGRSRDQIRVIAQVSERYRQTTMGVLRVTFLSALVLELVATLGTAVVAVEVGLRLLYGRLVFEQALFILLLAPEFYLPLRMLGTRFHAGMAGMAAAERIFEILNEPLAEGGPRSESLTSPTGAAAGVAIKFEDVHLAYADNWHALRGISFEIPAGTRLALVGRSGAGKSSIANLLLGFNSPDRGRITVNGATLEAMPSGAWRSQIAWVPQHPYLFHDTVAANILLGRPDADQAQLIQTAKLAHAHDFIQRLPLGYQTVIGEQGASLSAGQAQRLAIARAFLRDAPVLILDEATASLDPQSEDLIRASLARLATGRTTVMIAHRLSTVYQSDLILVLDQGRVAASGTHAELVETSHLYRELVAAYRGEVLPNELDAVTPPQTEAGGGWSESTSLTEAELGLDLLRENRVWSVEAVKEPGSVLARLLGFVTPFAPWVALSVLLGVATVASGLGLMASSAYLISAAALGPSIAELQVAIVGVRAFGLSRGIFRYLERLVSHRTTFHILGSLRVWFYQALEPLVPAAISRYRSGDLLSRMIGDINALESFYVRALAPPLVALVVEVCTYGYLWAFEPALATSTLLFMLLAGMIAPWGVRWLSRAPGRRLVFVQAALQVALLDGIQGLADLLVFDQEQAAADRVMGADEALRREQTLLGWIEGGQSALVNLLGNLAMWSALWIAIPLVRSGQIEAVYLASLALVVLSSFEALQPLPLAAQYLAVNLASAERLFEIVDRRPEVSDPPLKKDLPGGWDLQVSDLRFGYPAAVGENEQSQMDSKTPTYALDGISFNLSAGKRLAIVGPSGAGKSTLVNLLLRFWEYRHGTIRLGGRELHELEAETLRRKMAVLAQNSYLFSATVRENLLIARPETNEAEIVRAASAAQIHDVIQSLPQGYDTWVGEHGMRLSGGERQRIAVARGLLKDAPLLVLDEATAHIDPLTERAMLASLLNLMQGRSLLLITHRLVGMDAMDEILVLDRGRVIERGRHAELLGENGLYRRMWDLQQQVRV